MLAACLSWASFSVRHRPSELVFALSQATSTGPSCLHGNLYLMSAYLHIRTAQRERKRQRERAEGSREKEKGRERETEEKSNNSISTGSLNDATTATVWHFDKRGPDIVSCKTGLFLVICSLIVGKGIKKRISSEYPEPFCDNPFIPFVLARTFGQKRSAPLFY